MKNKDGTKEWCLVTFKWKPIKPQKVANPSKRTSRQSNKQK